MERKKYLFGFVAALLLGCGFVTAAAQQTNAQRIYDAYIGGNMQEWVGVISQMAEGIASKPVTEKLELLGYYYGHIGYLMGIDRNKEAKPYLDKAHTLVDEVLQAEPTNATALAYKGVFTAYRMNMNKITAPVLGSRTMRYIKKAYQTEPSNAQALADMGNMLYHAPAIFGGDKESGIEYIAKAVDRLEQTGQNEGNWNYLNLLVLQAQYLQETGQRDSALTVYEKILTIEPDFVWVRDELYPSIKQRMN